MSARLSGQSRIVQACMRCRSLKVKCVPSHQQAVCQRCLTTERDCVWPDTPKGARKPRGPSRISQVEKKIDGLVAHISNKHSPDITHPPPDNLCPDVDESPITHQNQQNNVTSSDSPERRPSNHVDDRSRAASSLQRIADMHNFETDQEDNQDDLVHDESRSEDERLVTKLLADQRAQPLLEQYYHMAPYFPFVPVDPSTAVEKMSKRTPILLLAIMTVASWRDRESQVQLEKQYKHELALRTIIEPRKDLALLQSILIYIAWYHYFVDPKLQNLALLQMCVGLITELKLDPEYIPRILPARCAAKRVRYGRDGQRALLGCYYLCSLNSSGLRISNIFKMSRHMYQCAQRLGQDQELDSDRLLSAMVDGRYLDDRIFDFHHATGLTDKKPTQDQLLAQLEVWEASLVELKKTASWSGNIIPLISSIHGTSLELYDTLFRSLRACDLTSSVASLTEMKINILSSCLEAGRSFLDTLVSVSTEDFALVPTTTWLPLPRILITLAMLTAPSEHHLPQWNVIAARDRVRLDLFLESLCFRMQSLSMFNPPINTQPDFWLAMKVVLQSVGKWYKRLSNRGQDNPVAKDSTAKGLPQWGTSLSFNQSQVLQPSSTVPSQSYSASGLACTPESANSHRSTLPEFPAALQPMISSITCPMMGGMNSGFDMDQFMDMGFWGNVDEGLDIMNFDFSA